MNEAMKEEIKHLQVLTGQAIQNGGPMMNFPASYGANQQHYPNNHAMNTMLTAQQFRQLQKIFISFRSINCASFSSNDPHCCNKRWT